MTGKVPLSAAIGWRVRCPDPGCGALATVEPSRGVAPRVRAPGMPPPPGNPHFAIVHCPRTGPKLFRAELMVEVVEGG